MSAAALALRHGRGIFFVAVACAAAGLYAAVKLPKGVYPEVTFPREQVVATLPGAPAATVLAGVTRPLEAAMASVPGVQVVRTRTIALTLHRVTRGGCRLRMRRPMRSCCSARCIT